MDSVVKTTLNSIEMKLNFQLEADLQEFRQGTSLKNVVVLLLLEAPSGDQTNNSENDSIVILDPVNLYKLLARRVIDNLVPG